MLVQIDGQVFVPAPSQDADTTIGDLVMDSGDLGKTLTIREYLKTLLFAVWDQGEGFSGKRPFGNGGWKWDIYRALVIAGRVDGTLEEEDGYVSIGKITKAEEEKAWNLVAKLIQSM